MKTKGRYLYYLLTILVSLAVATVSFADEHAKYYAAAEKYGKTPQAVTLYKWYADAAKPYRGKTIRSIFEKLPKTEYLAAKIAPMFTEITGIKVDAEMGSNEEVMQKEMMEAVARQGTYDFFYDDQDLVGTWNKRKSIVNLSQLMKDHPELVEPELDLDDFIPAVLNMYKDAKGELWNLPMEQYPKVYIYRSDLLEDPKEMAAFKEKYGYELAPAKTYKQYTDIAEFFTRPDQNLYGHACAAKRHPALAYEWTETHFLQAGVASPGIPWARPINGYGILVNDKEQMAGCSVATGGTVNSPKMKEFFKMYKNLIDNYSPPGILEFIWEEFAEAFKSGRAVQIANYYSQLIPPLDEEDSVVAGKFKVALPPVTEHWQEGMARGYWDSAGFIIPSGSKNVEPSWLFAQFVVSKAHELEVAKNVGCTIRKSVLTSPELMEADAKLGGSLSFQASPDALLLTGTDPTIEEYSAMLEIFYTTLHKGLTGEMSTDETLDQLAAKLDTELKRMGYPIGK